MSKHILVASSDDEFREFLTSLFRCGGADVTPVASGTECIESLQHFWPDTLVLDQDLKWGGIEGVLDWMRDDGSHSEVEVVLLVDDDLADESFSTYDEVISSILHP